MAVIPRFDGRIGQQLDTTSARTTTQLYVPPARNSSLEAFGSTVQQLSGKAAQIMHAEQERAAADYTTKTSAALQESVVRNMNASKQKALEKGSVDGFTDEFVKSYDDTLTAALDKAPNHLAREALQHRMLQARGPLVGQAMRFEADTRVSLYRHNLDKAADSYSKMAAMDPASIPQILKQLDGDMVAAKHTLGLPDAEHRLSAYKNQVIATSISQVIRENPYEAEGLIQRYQGNLSSKDFVALSNAAAREQQRIEKQALKARKEAQEIASVWGAVNGGIPLDPSSPDGIKAVDKFYETVKTNDPNADFSEVVLKTNIMPTAMKQELSGKLANGTTEQKVQAAQQLKVLHEQSPYLVSKMSKSDKAKASLIASYIQAGVAPGRAVEWAEKESTKATDAILKQRDKEAKKEEQLKFGAVEDEFTGWFNRGIEAIPDDMRSDYELLARAYYVDNGLPADRASANALNDLRANWYKSDVTGRSRYMKNAPEVVFKNGAGSDWIKEQFQEEYAKGVNGFEKPDSLILQADPILTRKGLPVYNIFRINEEIGSIEKVFDKNGKAALFQPEFESSSLYKKMLEGYEGKTFEEKRERYLQEMEEQQVKQLTRGQEPDVRHLSIVGY